MTGTLPLTRSVVVIGDGIVGLAAAIALRRALPDAAITLVELPGDKDSWIDRLGAATPVIHKFHRQIGLDPALFVRRAGAEPIFLRRYVGADGSEVREASTTTIAFVEGVALHQIWLRHRAESVDRAPDFAAMLLALRDARGDGGGFGARFDAAAYAALLGEMAAALGIARHDVDRIGVETDGAGVSGVVTPAGETLTANLYVDAAGPRSRLLAALGVEWHDWSRFLPSATLTLAPGTAGPVGEERLATTPAGLHWQTRRWSATIVPAGGAAPGRLGQSWRGNAVAIGAAALHVPAADGSLLGHALEDILRVIALLPRPGSGGSDTREYVRRTAIAQDALADWSSLCLVAGDGPRPDGLAAILAAFDARGRIVPRELDPIAPGHWLSRLMALRPPPRRIDPTALALPPHIVRTTIARAAPQ